MMLRATLLGAAMLAAAGCAHDGSRVQPARGDTVGVNSYPGTMPPDAKASPVTGATTPGIELAPSAMATTGSAGNPVDTRSAVNAGMGTSGSTASNGSAASNR